MQLVKQGLGLFQIERVEAFGEPAVDRSEKIAGLIPLALTAPKVSKVPRRRSSSERALWLRAIVNALSSNDCESMLPLGSLLRSSTRAFSRYNSASTNRSVLTLHIESA